jgi:NTE family protein
MSTASIGLALSGGGSRGIMHLGVLKALDEMNVRIDRISGVSAGSICGAFYLAGFSPEDTLRIVKEYGVHKWMRPSWSRKGLLSTAKLMQLFGKYLPENFSALRAPLYITATDILRGESVTYCEGPLLPPLCGSMGLPVVFQPVEFEGRLLLDGGILNNLAIEPLEHRNLIIIGAHSNFQSHDMPKLGFRNVMDRCLHLAINKAVYMKTERCGILIDPPEMANYHFLDSKHLDEVFAIGYKATMEVRAELEQLELC